MLRYLMLILWFSFFIVSNIFTEEKIDLFLEEKKFILNGEISKGLGQYDDHLKGIVEFLVCSKGGKEYESIIGAIEADLRKKKLNLIDNKSARNIRNK